MRRLWCRSVWLGLVGALLLGSWTGARAGVELPALEVGLDDLGAVAGELAAVERDERPVLLFLRVPQGGEAAARAECGGDLGRMARQPGLRLLLMLPVETHRAERVEPEARRLEELLLGCRGAVGGVVLVDEAGAVEPDTRAFALRRLATTARGVLGADAWVLVGLMHPSMEAVAALYERGLVPYVEGLVVVADLGRDQRRQLARLMRRWTLRHRLVYRVPGGAAEAAPREALLEGLTSEATPLLPWQPGRAAWLATLAATLPPSVGPDRALRLEIDAGSGGDAQLVPLLDAEDLSTWLVGRLPGGARVTLGSSWYGDRVEWLGREAPSAASRLHRGRRESWFVAPPGAGGLRIARLPRPSTPTEDRELLATDVTARRSITVEEIIARHQAQRAGEAARLATWRAPSLTTLRFRFAAGTPVFELGIEGHFFKERDGGLEWAWDHFLVDGLRWRSDQLPELPIVEPEKMARPPLDIRLSRDYDYRLVDEASWQGEPCYRVRFEPAEGAPADETTEPLRGVAWIHRQTFALVHIESLRTSESGEVLSVDERTDFRPVDPRTGHWAAATDPDVVWLPQQVRAELTLRVAGRITVIERLTEVGPYQVNDPQFATARRQVHASTRRILTETPEGLRYLVPTGSGERRLKAAGDRRSWAILGGLFADDALESILPLAGVTYFDLDATRRGSQLNVFFAGALLTATWAEPRLLHPRLGANADLFVLAVPVADAPWRGGIERKEETVRTRSGRVALGLGARLGPHLNVRLSLARSRFDFLPADETADDFVVPRDTWTTSGEVELRFDRQGWSGELTGEVVRRDRWAPWGRAGGEDYEPRHRQYGRYGLALSKTFGLPRFQRLQLGMAASSGWDLDRFSRYGIGFFGRHRVHGFKSGALRGDDVIALNATYGFNLASLVRLDLQAETAWLRNRADGPGARFERVHGVGLAGQVLLPWGIISRFDLGVPIDPPRGLDGWVANVVFLKLL